MLTGAITTLAVPTPFNVGDVNCFLIHDDPLTLVDSGPDTPAARAAIDAQLAASDLRVEDLERIVITHQHLDHAGLAAWLQDRSGAEVLCFDALVPLLARYREAMEEDDAFAVEVMLKHGIPQAMAAALRSETKAAHAYGLDLGGATGLRDGDVLEFAGRSWTVHHRPGHSPSDIVFYDSDSAELIAGDHLLARISSNPIIHLPLDRSRIRPRALLTYISSLKQTAEMHVSRIHGGHGAAVEDHRELISERLGAFDRRAAKIGAVLARGPMNAHEIARALWGEIAVKQGFLTLSETLGHLDVLVERGSVVERDGDVVRFELV
ncbi:MAG TPA: MBL fold metallo-hydrolase [Baekduia sp.]|nr:MBL fold metallo-hydrolase [Baekduia sp.]